MTVDIFTAVSTLKADWPSLTDVDRAERIVSIQAAGMSRRTLAKSLCKNESVLRHIEPLIDANEHEKNQIRASKTRTKIVLRAIMERRADDNPETRLKIEVEAWAATIASWARAQFGSVHGKQVVHEVRLRLSARREHAVVSPGVDLSSLDRIITLCRPKSDDRFYFERESVWLESWVSYAISEPAVREAAMAAAEGLLTAPIRRPR